MSRKKGSKNHSSGRLRLPSVEVNADVRKDLFGILLFALGMLTVLSFLSLSGTVGADLNRLTRLLFGWGFVFFPVLLFAWGFRVIRSEGLFKSQAYMFGVFGIVLSALGLLHINYRPEEMLGVALGGNGGGLLGAALAWILVGVAGKWGGIVLGLTLLVASVIFTFETSLLDILTFLKPPALVKTAAEKRGKGKEKEKEGSKASPAPVIEAGFEAEEKKSGLLSSLKDRLGGGKQEAPAEEMTPVFAVRTMGEVKSVAPTVEERPAPAEEDIPLPEEEKEQEAPVVMGAMLATRMTNWKLPSPDLLSGSDSEPTSGDIQANSNIIKRTLGNFGIEVEMGEVNVGPTVTQYTLKPSIGVKLSRITALQNDLALALAARTLRLEAPIPGKSWVGLELPNQSVAMVTLKTILESPEFRSRKSNLSMILGRAVDGSAVIANVAKMPHLLVAGATGSGKTVCVNTLITGLLFQNSPADLKFIMVDPKRVELTPYNDIPHLLTPVITDPDKAINALKWAVKEMENRYDLLSKFGCRNIESYNDTVRSGRLGDQEPLFYIIIVIDEMADLMATHGREMEAVVVRLAQMARAIGIHLVLSTQRPSVEVITGLIKANITTRIAFCVASQIDSRTILDASGAEKLLGNGDMLYISSDSNKPKRIQGVFISEEEVRKVVEFIKEQKEGEVEFNSEIVEGKKFGSDPMAANDDVDDDLYSEALEVVRESGKASASLLQRRIKVGYARAARLLDIMEDRGVIGPAQGAKPREVYLEGAPDAGQEDNPDF